MKVLYGFLCCSLPILLYISTEVSYIVPKIKQKYPSRQNVTTSDSVSTMNLFSTLYGICAIKCVADYENIQDRSQCDGSFISPPSSPPPVVPLSHESEQCMNFQNTSGYLNASSIINISSTRNFLLSDSEDICCSECMTRIVDCCGFSYFNNYCQFLRCESISIIYHTTLNVKVLPPSSPALSPPAPSGEMIGKACMYMNSSINANMSSAEVTDQLNNCIQTCADDKCRQGCRNFIEAYEDVYNVCFRFTSIANKSTDVNPIATIPNQTISECCTRCQTTIVDDIECAGFVFEPSSVHSYIELEGSPQSYIESVESTRGDCSLHAPIINSNLMNQNGTTVYLYDRLDQPPSPPSPPVAPPPPQCVSFETLPNLRIRNATDCRIATTERIGEVSTCCYDCLNTFTISFGLCQFLEYDLETNMCTFYFQCNDPLNILMQSEHANMSNVLRRLDMPPFPPAQPPLPPKSPPVLPSSVNISYPPPPPNDILYFLTQPQTLIPLLVGLVLIAILVVLLFVFCNQERSIAITNILKSIRGTGRSQNININIQNVDAQDINPTQNDEIKTNIVQNPNRLNSQQVKVSQSNNQAQSQNRAQNRTQPPNQAQIQDTSQPPNQAQIPNKLQAQNKNRM